MSNEEAVNLARKVKDPEAAAKQLTTEALNRDSKDDISCVVVRFKKWAINASAAAYLEFDCMGSHL